MSLVCDKTPEPQRYPSPPYMHRWFINGGFLAGKPLSTKSGDHNEFHGTAMGPYRNFVVFKSVSTQLVEFISNPLQIEAMYRRIIAEQAIKAKATASQSSDKLKYEYDSDEETEGGTWEHKKRKKEMDKTFSESAVFASSQLNSYRNFLFLETMVSPKYLKQQEKKLFLKS